MRQSQGKAGFRRKISASESPHLSRMRRQLDRCINNWDALIAKQKSQLRYFSEAGKCAIITQMDLPNSKSPAQSRLNFQLRAPVRKPNTPNRDDYFLGLALLELALVTLSSLEALKPKT